MTIFCSKYNPGPFYCASCKLDCFLSLLLAHNLSPFVGCFAFFFILAFCSSLSLSCAHHCVYSPLSHHDESRLRFLRVVYTILFSFLRFSVPFALVQNTVVKFQHLWRRRKINTSRKYLFIISSLSHLLQTWSLEFFLSLSLSLIFVVNNYRRQKFARSSQALGFRHLNKLPIRIRLLFLVRSGVIFPLRLPTLLYRIQVRPRPSALIFLSLSLPAISSALL
jgi:hypothetical protein